MKPYISVVIPLYNEEENIPLLFKELLETLTGFGKKYEILFVDDGSRDQTIEKLIKEKEQIDEESKKLSTIKIIQFSRNYGQTAAMQAGFDYSEAKYIISLDGDLQNDPNDIPAIVNELESGYDLVTGWRIKRKDNTLTRIIPSKIANWIIGKMTGVPIHDNGCSLKGYKRNIVKNIQLYSDMHRFIPALSTTVGAKITELAVNHRPRMFGSTKYGLSRTFKVLVDIVSIKMIIHFAEKPLYLFSMISIPIFLIALSFAVSSIYISLHSQSSIIHSSISFLFFTLFAYLLSLGILGEYLLKTEKKI